MFFQWRAVPRRIHFAHDCAKDCAKEIGVLGKGTQWRETWWEIGFSTNHHGEILFFDY